MVRLTYAKVANTTGPPTHDVEQYSSTQREVILHEKHDAGHTT